MSDDFNTPEAVAALFGLSREVNTSLTGEVGRATLERALQAFKTLGGDVLGLFADSSGEGQNPELMDTLLELVLDSRTNYRLNKEWTKSDALRDKLQKVGIVLEDTAQGTRWKLE